MIKLKNLSYRTLLIFSLPSIMSSLLEPLASIVDTAFVGKINTEWLAALALATVILNSFTWVFNFLVHATTQSVSELSHMKDRSRFLDRVRIALLASVAIGALASILLWLFRFPLYSLAGADDDIVGLVDRYFEIRIIAHPLLILYVTLISILRGLGKVNISFLYIMLTTVSNIVLNWVFLYHLKMDLSGAAWGTVIANGVGVLLCLLTIVFNPVFKGLFSSIKTSLDQWMKFGKDSLNIFLRTASITFAFFISTRLASTLGVEYLAAHQILVQIYLFSSFFTDGVAISGNVLGARYFSTRKIKVLRIVFERLLHLGGMIGLIFTLTYFIAGARIIGLFTNDSNVVGIVLGIWPLIYLSQVVSSVAFTYDGLMFGLGEFAFLRKHIMIAVFLVFLPIALGLLIWKSLWFVWIGLILLNVYRGIVLFNRTKQVLA